MTFEKAYWDEVWAATSGVQVDPFEPAPRRLRGYMRHQFDLLFRTQLGMAPRAGARLIEIGCGGSSRLPYFARHLGYKVASIDYSEVGCRQAQAILRRAEIDGQIVHSDLFSPPPELLRQFDAVISFGVVEHFSNLDEVIRAIAAFAAPGGRVLTLIPNMRGLTGLIQMIGDREIYDIHVPYTPSQLEQAHMSAGLEVQFADYVMSANFTVPALGRRYSARIKKFMELGQRIASVPFWLVELAGIPVRPNRLTSPYALCVASKPAEAKE